MMRVKKVRTRNVSPITQEGVELLLLLPPEESRTKKAPRHWSELRETEPRLKSSSEMAQVFEPKLSVTFTEVEQAGCNY